MDQEPPLQQTYKTLLHNSSLGEPKKENIFMAEECDLPLIDLSQLNAQRDKCIKLIAQAAREWGFFQVLNHGISQEVLKILKDEQMKVFHLPFQKKIEDNFLNLSANSYRWGNSKATSLKQVLWSEALHLSLADISRMDECKSTLRSAIEAFVTVAGSLAQSLAEILSQILGIKSTYFQENCPPNTSYLRLNRYPPCPFPSKAFGFMPHTDSSFLTILHQDHVGGLQLLKDGKWFRVKPNPQALVINIGDLFQALSNDSFKSIKHRVVSSEEIERFSVAYFYCPSNDAVIQSCCSTKRLLPGVYKHFSFREYQQQVRKDVEATGDKVGLSRFLL
ncbi:gibberellin 2-beta-dioxygenase 8-like isoform X1 [Corylus avellana]|uniref:gibberellin 2-beta-dioxygenase 8-like isoform X1 n=1 Tax=Corylus avellana TaxID=13451 RepID=UPI001E22F524|nr:gibberellin 2-beta-dioxygenase 8-like isoform X1 [Corylus avellana]